MAKKIKEKVILSIGDYPNFVSKNEELRILNNCRKSANLKPLTELPILEHAVRDARTFNKIKHFKKNI